MQLRRKTVILLKSEIIEIDGSYQEGGGQILRTATALSSITGKPVKIFNIRAKRCNPGLQIQHLESVNALAQLCNAKTKGAELHSTELEFYPEKISANKINISISTAGSVALTLQGLMFAAMHAPAAVEIDINGGATAGKWAAPVNYLKYVLLPLLAKCGYKAEIEIKKHGYYPKGGAEVFVKIFPSELKPLQLIERGKLLSIKGISHASSSLKNKKVAERMKESAEKIIFGKLKIKPEIEVKYVDAVCPGCGIELFANYENTVLGADGLGEIKKSAEQVGREAAEKLVEYCNADACLDRHMADQILPYIALAAERGPSSASVAEITKHCLTNIWVIEKFLPVKFSVEGKLGEKGIISVKKMDKGI